MKQILWNSQFILFPLYLISTKQETVSVAMVNTGVLNYWPVLGSRDVGQPVADMTLCLITRHDVLCKYL